MSEPLLTVFFQAQVAAVKATTGEDFPPLLALFVRKPHSPPTRIHIPEPENGKIQRTGLPLRTQEAEATTALAAENGTRKLHTGGLSNAPKKEIYLTGNVLNLDCSDKNEKCGFNGTNQ